ncbi:MAG: DUF4363 family protein [Peptococcaceae bacterium]|nr:DUF4363 family protein [Peptococcaceae bacterium]
MRAILIMLVSFLILGTLSWTSHSYIYSVTGHLQTQAQTAEDLLRLRQWEQLQQELQSLHIYWESRRNKMAVLLDHQDVNTLEDILLRLESYADSQADTLAFSEMASLRSMLKNMRERETISLYNIF